MTAVLVVLAVVAVVVAVDVVWQIRKQRRALERVCEDLDALGRERLP